MWYKTLDKPTPQIYLVLNIPNLAHTTFALQYIYDNMCLNANTVAFDYKTAQLA